MTEGLDKFIAIAKYPCCNKKVRFTLFPVVPLQKFERTCPICGIKWSIGCKVLKRDIEGITITKAEWSIEND